MAQVFLIGSVTADLELRISARKVPYNDHAQHHMEQNQPKRKPGNGCVTV